MSTQVTSFDFTQACKYLRLAPGEFLELRHIGLIGCVVEGEQRFYPRTTLDLTSNLIALGQARNWKSETLAWYADLLFAAEIGRAILLPLHEDQTGGDSQPVTWLETPYATAVLDDISGGTEKSDAAVQTPLRSLLAITVGDGQFWYSLDDLKKSPLYPVVCHFEDAGVPVLGQRTAIARDVGVNFVSIMFAFLNIAPPISKEFAQLVSAARKNLKGMIANSTNASPDEQALILRQPLIPVDKIYASKATEIHMPSETWDFQMGILRSERRTIAIQIKLPLDSDKPFIDNIIDMIRPFVGPFGARVVHLLYEIANDPPYYRTPVITVDTNNMLDRLGMKRDKKGFHRSKNRERLRDALNAAHALEIVGEYTTREDGKTVVKAFYRTVLSLIGATFDPGEREGISTAELRIRGLPKSMQIRLNFYDGIRRPDGRLGNQYVYVPRLADSQVLPKANHSATSEQLKAYLLFQYRQTQMKSRTLTIKRQTALEKAGVTTRNVTRATQILTRALDKLQANGILDSFTKVPLKAQESFTVVLSTSSTPDETI